MAIKYFFLAVFARAIKFLILHFNTLFHNSALFLGSSKKPIYCEKKKKQTQLHIDRKVLPHTHTHATGWNKKLSFYRFWLIAFRSCRFEFEIFGRLLFHSMLWRLRANNWLSIGQLINRLLFMPGINQYLIFNKAKKNVHVKKSSTNREFQSLRKLNL